MIRIITPSRLVSSLGRDRGGPTYRIHEPWRGKKIRPDLRQTSFRGHNCRKKSGQGGFTLLEMVVAVAIFAFMGVMAFGGLNSMTRSSQATTETGNRLGEVQFAVTYLVRDFMQLSPRKIRNQYGDVEDQLVLDEEGLRFTRSGWDNLLGQSRSTLQRLHYRLVDDRLVRTHWRNLDQGIAEESIDRVLLSGLKTLRFRLMSAEEEIIDSWPFEAGVPAGQPVVLEVVMQVDGLGEITRVLELPEGAI